jgi:DNA-directed RNA polymerase subunit RPC12/RpoP
MILVSNPKPRDTRKVGCPHCKSRLCDVVVSGGNKIAVQEDCDSNLLIKCRKCKRQIGITLVFAKAK